MTDPTPLQELVLTRIFDAPRELVFPGTASTWTSGSAATSGSSW